MLSFGCDYFTWFHEQVIWSLTIECVLLLYKAFVYYRMCSLTWCHEQVINHEEFDKKISGLFRDTCGIQRNLRMQACFI